MNTFKVRYISQQIKVKKFFSGYIERVGSMIVVWFWAELDDEPDIMKFHTP